MLGGYESLNYLPPDSKVHRWGTSSGKKDKFGHFVVVVQLIHRLAQADISWTTTARVFFFPTV